MRFTSLVLIAVAGILAVPAAAKPAFVKKAKDLGLADVKNCQFCHVEKMPSKAKMGEYTDAGKFLVKKKADTKAAEVDVAWLKDYKK